MIKLRTALYDLEADGLDPSVIHCIVIREAESDFEFVADTPDLIKQAVTILEMADMTVAHNLIDYDGRVLRKLLNYKPRGKERDSFVCAQVLMGDIREVYDFIESERKKQRAREGVVQPYEWKGKYLGSHSLEAWGYRLGLPKGDYAEMMKKKGLDPWAKLNKDMVEYCRSDVNVLKLLWLERIIPLMKDGDPKKNENVIALEHFMQRQMSALERNGVRLDVAAAERLCAALEIRERELSDEVTKLFGARYEPKKWVIKLHPENTDERLARLGLVGQQLRKQDKDKNYTIRYRTMWQPLTDKQCDEFGMGREAWGQYVEPAVRKRDNLLKRNPGAELPLLEYYEVPGAPHIKITEGAYTPIILKPVKPSSRVQLARRLLELGWVPEMITEATGQPVISDAELQKLGETVPIAKKIATLFLVKKRLGQIKTGKQAWLRLVDEHGYLHPRIRPCATITARAAHSSPNISQVPAVLMKDVPNPARPTDPDEIANLEVLVDKLQNLMAPTADERARLKTAKKLLAKTVPVVAWGEEGEWGADCRALFIVPDGWKQVGADLSGIELRAFANDLYPFDDGAFLQVLLEKDVHEENRKILGIPNRTDAKRFIFAWLYGAGDEKLGSIIYPHKNALQQKAAGRMFREQLTAGIKGTAKLLNTIRMTINNMRTGFREAANYRMPSSYGKPAPRKMQEGDTQVVDVAAEQFLYSRTTVGYLPGIDGRLLGVRGMHSALNTRLQSSGAIVAKYWVYALLKSCEAKGWRCGYDGDYVFTIWSHDEVQFAVRGEIAEEFAALATAAAPQAGKMLGMRVPIEAEAKIGDNWQQTH